MADWTVIGGITALGGIIGYLGAKTVDSRKLPAGEKAVLTGASTGATMEGLEALMAAESFAAEEGFDRNCKVCKGTGWMPKKGDPKEDAELAKLFGVSIDELVMQPCNAGGKDMGCFNAESFSADEDCKSCGDSFEEGYNERCENCDGCEDCCKDNGETCSNPACEIEECEEDVYWHEGDKPYCYNCGLVFKKAKYSAESFSAEKQYVWVDCEVNEFHPQHEEGKPCGDCEEDIGSFACKCGEIYRPKSRSYHDNKCCGNPTPIGKDGKINMRIHGPTSDYEGEESFSAEGDYQPSFDSLEERIEWMEFAVGDKNWRYYEGDYSDVVLDIEEWNENNENNSKLSNLVKRYKKRTGWMDAESFSADASYNFTCKKCGCPTFTIQFKKSYGLRYIEATCEDCGKGNVSALADDTHFVYVRTPYYDAESFSAEIDDRLGEHRWILDEKREGAEKDTQVYDYLAMTLSMGELEIGKDNARRDGDKVLEEHFLKAINRQKVINELQAEDIR